MDLILEAHGLRRGDLDFPTLQKCISGNYSNDDMERIARVCSTNKELKIKGLPGLLFSNHDGPDHEMIEVFPILNSDHKNSDHKNSNHKNENDHQMIEVFPILNFNHKNENEEDDDDNDGVLKKSILEQDKLVAHISDIALKTLSESDLNAAETAGLTAAEYFVVKGSYGTVLGLQLDVGAFKMAYSKCKAQKALKLKDDREQSKIFVYSHIVGIAKKKLKSANIKALYSPQQIPSECKKLNLNTPIGKSIHNATMLLKTIIDNPLL
jgi:hypothetical protein